jgi:hypothetical protein
MDADDLQELCSALSTLANDLLYEGQEQREQTSGGWSSGHHLVLTLTDETMDGDTYRRLLREWSAARRGADIGRNEPLWKPDEWVCSHHQRSHFKDDNEALEHLGHCYVDHPDYQ